MSVLVYDVFDDARCANKIGCAHKIDSVLGAVQVPVVSEECLRQWWHRRFVDGIDTVTLMAQAQRWVDQLAIAAVALLEVDVEGLRELLPPHELSWLLEMHRQLPMP